MGEVEKRYEALKKKYGLPNLKELSREFEIKLDDPNSILNDVVSRITERISDCGSILEEIIFVNSSSTLSRLYEAKMLEKKKHEAFKFFKTLMSIKWKGEKIKTGGNEEEMATFIKEIHDRWKNDLKHKFVEICELFEEEWKDAELGKSPTSLMYHG